MNHMEAVTKLTGDQGLINSEDTMQLINQETIDNDNGVSFNTLITHALCCATELHTLTQTHTLITHTHSSTSSAAAEQQQFFNSPIEALNFKPEQPLALLLRYYYEHEELY